MAVFERFGGSGKGFDNPGIQTSGGTDGGP